MAAYTAKLSVHKTLTAATVDTVTLDADYQQVEVLNRGTDPIYFCVDGRGGPASDGVPTVAGDNTEVVAGGGALIVRSNDRGGTVVKLVSAAAAPYSVRGVLD